MITASHNPIDWNGIEFASESGRLLGEAERRCLMEVYESGDFELAAWDKQGSVKLVDTAVEQHIAGVLDCDWGSTRSDAISWIESRHRLR